MMLEHYAQELSHFLQVHPNWGGFITFIIAFAESLPIVGTIIPGSVTMTAIGILIGSSLLPFSITLLWATCGAFLGDLIGYVIGRVYNERLRGVWPFRKYPNLLDRGEIFFRKHGGKSILIGRFVGPARSFIPLIAGLLQLSWQRFILAAIPSAALWALIYMLPGILIGAVSVQLPPGVAMQVMLVLVWIIILISLFAWLIKYLFYRAKVIWRWKVNSLWSRLCSQKKYKNFVDILAIKSQREDARQLSWFIFAIIFFALFVVDFFSILQQKWLANFNVPIFEFLRSIRHAKLDTIMIGFTVLGSGWVLLPSGLIILIWFIARKRWNEFVHWLSALLIGSIVPNVIKLVVYSPRPTGLWHGPTTSSFPSGHAFLAVMFFGTLTTLITSHLSAKIKAYFYYVTTLLIICISFSRIYLGVHWFTDVLGSFLFAAGFWALVSLSYRRNTQPLKNVKELIVVALTSVAALWCILFITQNHRLFKDYSIAWPTTMIPTTAWWGQSNPIIPTYRENRFGKPVEPMNIQWAGNSEKIKKLLLRQGWRVNLDDSALKNAVKTISQSQETMNSILPDLYQNQVPALYLIKDKSENEKLILRLWFANVYLSNPTPILYIGNIVSYNSNAPKRKMKNFNAITELVVTLPVNWKIVSANSIPRQLQKKGWDGKILQVTSPS